MIDKESLKNDATEFGTDDEKMGRLLNGMKRVDAPNDFDFRVKARIAAGRPAARPAFGLAAAARFAIPLILLVLVGAYFGFNAFYTDRYLDVPAVAETAPTITPASIPSPSNDVVVTSLNETVGDRAAVKKPNEINNTTGSTPVKKTPNVDLPANRPGGGSVDMASLPPRSFSQRGLDQNVKLPANANGSEHDAQIPVKEVLSLIGVRGAFSSSGLKVTSADGIAGRSGVKSADVIEAINGQAVTGKALFGSKFSGKSLSVLRNGERIQILLKN